MSPAQQIRRQPAHPLTVIRDAVLWARAADIKVRLGSIGVHCTSSLAAIRWEKDPNTDGVCPLGAAILHRQPQATHVDAAAAEAINAPAQWLAGFQAAVDHTDLAGNWVHSVHRRLAAAGFEAGTMYREEFIRTRPASVLE